MTFRRLRGRQHPRRSTAIRHPNPKMRRRGRASLPDNPHFAKIQASLHKTTAIGRLCGEIHKQKHRLVEPLLVSGPSFGDFHASEGHIFTHAPAYKILEYEENIEALQVCFAKMLESG